MIRKSGNGFSLATNAERVWAEITTPDESRAVAVPSCYFFCAAVWIAFQSNFWAIASASSSVMPL